MPQGPESTPHHIYEERITRFKNQFDAETERWNRIANLRLFTFLAAAAALPLGFFQSLPLLTLAGALLLVTFFILVRYHNIIGRQRRRHEELWRINLEGSHRLTRNWPDLPLRHTTRPQTNDPYAADLDIFGRASLFHLLETVSTHMGEATLTSWLSQPAPPDEVHARQSAVAELGPLIDLRDELSLRGRLMGDPKPDPAPFLAWAESDTWLTHRPWLLWWARLSVLLLWALIIAQSTGLTPYPLWVAPAVANFILNQTLGRTVYRTLSQASAGESGFKHYADAFELLCDAPLQSPPLLRIKASLTAEGEGGGVPAHLALRRLHRLTTTVIPMSSQLYIPIQALTMWDVHLLSAFERWQSHAGRHSRAWLDALGETESLSALASLSHDNPTWAFPTLDPGAATFDARDLGHPLLPADTRVTNDVEVGPPGTFLLVTGSNMSGKSTLLRAIGANIVLAQAGGPVCASSLTMPPVSLWTSMRIEDSLERGVSYFMAEVQRLKRVVDAARATHDTERRLFYLLDEILQGTNTDERQIAARRVIMYLVEQGALGAVSTHDLTLADQPDIAAAARLVHFTETISNTADGGPQMTFDYKLRPGLATSTNALRLMELVGL